MPLRPDPLPDLPPPPSGYWLSGGSGSTGGLFAAADRIIMVPLLLHKSAALNWIAVDVTSAGTAGAVFRLGAYKTGEDLRPEHLLFDAGTVDATTTGQKSISVSERVPAGLVWLAAAEQGGATTRPQCRLVDQHVPQWAIPNSTLSWSTNYGVRYNAAVSGAFPATLTPGNVNADGGPPHVRVKVQ